MSVKLAFFEIPAVDFDRAVNFYQKVLGFQLNRYECDTEKMAFIENSDFRGAISYSKHLKPSSSGVLISFEVQEIVDTLLKAEEFSGKTIIGKSLIEVECGGFFAVFEDSEGNRIGLNSKK